MFRRVLFRSLNSRLPNVSKWQFGASADGTFPLGGGLELRPHADWNYRSSLYVDSANTHLLYQKGVSLVNAALTLAEEDARWQITPPLRTLLAQTVLVPAIAHYTIAALDLPHAPPRDWARHATLPSYPTQPTPTTRRTPHHLNHPTP